MRIGDSPPARPLRSISGTRLAWGILTGAITLSLLLRQHRETDDLDGIGSTAQPDYRADPIRLVTLEPCTSPGQAFTVALEVGEWNRFGGAEAECLQLPPTSGAAYVLAYVHLGILSPIRADGGGALRPIWIRLTDMLSDHRPSPDFRGTPLRVEASAAAARSGEYAATRVCSVEKWEDSREIGCLPHLLGPGDTVTLALPNGRRTGVGVLGVRGNVVLALPSGELEALSSAAASVLLAVAKDLERTGFPIFRDAMTPSTPRSSVPTGQYIVLVLHEVSELCGSHRACLLRSRSPFRAATAVGESGLPSTLIAVQVPTETSYAGLLGLLAHEFAHAWQLEYLREQKERGLPYSPPATWQMEGAATFLEREIVRVLFGFDLLGNLPTTGAVPPGLQAYGRELLQARGWVMNGYDHAASFFRDLYTRHVHATGSDQHDARREALREIARGAIEGWEADVSPHVSAATGGEEMQRVGGLTARMRRLSGQEWNPSDALLVWTVSQALDDLSGSDAFQNRSFLSLRNSDPEGIATVGWLPLAALRPERKLHVEHAVPFGSTGYYHLLEDGRGARWRITTGSEQVEWMLVRFR
jgi:hypothetical protein